MESNKLGLPQGHYIFVWGGLIKDAGGMTRVMLDRLCRFKKAGVQVTVLLGGRGKEQYDAVDVYREAGYPAIRREDFVCIEDWLAKKLTNGQLVEERKPDGIFFAQKKGLEQEVYLNGLLVGKRYFDDSNQLVKAENYSVSSGSKKIIESIDFYYNNKRFKRRHIINDSEKCESYFADNGFCYMTCHIYDGKEKGVTLFDQNDCSVTEYANISDLREYFYSQYVMEQYTQDLFVICDPILDLEPGYRYMYEKPEHKLYKIAVNHGIGFAPPRNWNSRCNPRFQRYLEVPSCELDAVVILTDVALKNIKKRFGERNIFKCIPNKVNLNPERNPIKKRNRNKTVFAGRFSEEKQCVDVVKAFALVVKQYPNAILELYGRGNTEENIQAEIINNGLEKNVFVKGFSRDIQEVFSDAILSVVSSEFTFESFCLSLVESLASGCPVVSYEMKFGAAYVIQDGYNGYLAQSDNIEQLAEKIINVYKMNDKELEVLSKNAYETAQIFSPEKYQENWKIVLNEIVAQKEKQSFIDNLEVEINNLTCSFAQEKKYILQGKLTVSGKIPACAEEEIKIYARNYTKDRNDYTISAATYSKEGENTYSFEMALCDIHTPIGICFECTNSFLEKDITQIITAM